jgi:hypothetical protein
MVPRHGATIGDGYEEKAVGCVVRRTAPGADGPPVRCGAWESSLEDAA